MGRYILIKTKKGQVWSLDIVVALLIFVSGIVILFFYAINYNSQSEQNLEDLLSQGNFASELILSDNPPYGILTNNIVDQNKLTTFYYSDYQTLRQSLGLKDNFYFVMDDMEVYDSPVPIGDINLVLHLESEDDLIDGESTDSSSYGNDGICTFGTSCPNYLSSGGNDGSGAYYYNGFGNYLNSGNDNSLSFGNGGLTVMGWIFPQTAGDDRIANNRGRGSNLVQAGWQLKIKSDSPGTWGFFDSFVNDIDGNNIGCYSGYCGSAGDRWPLGEWRHVAMTFDNQPGVGTDTITFYVDGVEIYSNTATNIDNINPQNSLPTIIGAALYANGVLSTPAQLFEGSMDDVYIFNRVLDSGEVSDIYNSIISFGPPPEEELSLIPVDYVGKINETIVSDNVKVNRIIVYKNKPVKFGVYIWR